MTSALLTCREAWLKCHPDRGAGELPPQTKLNDISNRIKLLDSVEQNSILTSLQVRLKTTNNKLHAIHIEEKKALDKNTSVAESTLTGTASFFFGSLLLNYSVGTAFGIASFSLRHFLVPYINHRQLDDKISTCEKRLEEVMTAMKDVMNQPEHFRHSLN